MDGESGRRQLSGRESGVKPVRQEQSRTYRDQFEYFADCFELIRKRGDAYNLRSEAMETERMVSYSEHNGFVSDRTQLLEIYRDIETEANRKQAQVLRCKKATSRSGIRFPFDDFIRRYGLRPEEVQILLVLLYNESLGRSHARFTTGNEILNLLFSNPVDALKASKFLDGGATLLEKGLVRSISDDDSTNFLRAAYEVSEKTLHQVLGVRDRRTIQDQQHSQLGCKPLDSSYRVVAPQVSLDQVVLSPAVRQGLNEILWQAKEGKFLYRDWGLDKVMEKGRGTVVLFSGPPGTGKTMTAEAMASHMGKTLHIADYAQIESKWIGDTEKNIVTIFREAARDDAVLLLDEADAILSARLEGGQYNDRAYNRQVSILLTELEAFEGLCILTTNRMVTLDEGLARRISATFTFNVPGPSERLRIWQSLLPGRVPLAEDIDLESLAHRYPMAGGHIKNAILTAVRKAALRDGRNARVMQKDFGEAAAIERRSFRPGSRIGFREGGTTSLYT
jgi:AAA+ superfamily predicted ATPase